MARSKSKPETKSTQLELFPQQQPVETGQDKEQSNTGQTDQQAEAAPPKKRTRTKKSSDQPAQTTDPEVPSPEQAAEPVTTTLPIEEAPPPLKSADSKQTEKKEARLKENFKKIQEERLAALRKAREKK